VVSQFLAERVALVTGSTSGIGLGIARALAGAGATVVLNGFGKPDEIAATQAAIGADFGVKVAYSAADMSKPESIAEMIQMTLDRFGRLDVLVNNAGIQHVAPLQEFPAAKWDAILAINLSSAFHTTRLALPGMIANKWGRIVNLASVIWSPISVASAVTLE
jgi:3-hydroxybutyrate dehydrogenase